MKLILIIVLIICCTYIGYGFSRYYANRKNFFNDVIMLLDKLRLDINFSKEKIGDIVCSFKPFSKQCSSLCTNFKNLLDENIFDENKLFEGINFLKTDEKNTLSQFFKSLGRFDIANQTNQINAFQEEIKKYQQASVLYAEKFCSLYIKIGFIVGILIALILV